MSTIKRAAPYLLVFAMYSQDGTQQSGLSVSAQVSKDGGAFATSANAVSEIGASGVYRLQLTAAEMDAEVVTVKATAAGALAMTAVLTTEALRNHELLTAPIADYETGAPFRSLLGAVAKLVNRTRNDTAAGKLRIYRTDDLTELATQTIATDAGAAPIVEVNTD